MFQAVEITRRIFNRSWWSAEGKEDKKNPLQPEGKTPAASIRRKELRTEKGEEGKPKRHLESEDLKTYVHERRKRKKRERSAELASSSPSGRNRERGKGENQEPFLIS